MAVAPPAAGGGASYGGGADSVRIDGLETQLRALSAQIQQLTDQVRALGGQPRRSDAGARRLRRCPGCLHPIPPMPDPARAAVPLPTRAASARRRSPPAAVATAIGGLIETAPPAAGAHRAAAPAGDVEAPGAEGPAGTDMAALPPAFGAATAPNAADAGNAKQLYETAYGYLMQRDYGAAQGAFEDFLTRYPQDSLAGNAQYWLGEAHFVRGEYKAAASSFLKGYQNYAGNARAADSLLKLAMSLDRLGQKDAACSSFGELSTRFPNAPENVKMRAKSERQRIGCT